MRQVVMKVENSPDNKFYSEFTVPYYKTTSIALYINIGSDYVEVFKKERISCGRVKVEHWDTSEIEWEDNFAVIKARAKWNLINYSVQVIN